jgi:tetratricopeptide (TPR) repeat protein
MRRVYGDDHVNVARLLSHRGAAEQAVGRSDAAIASYREALVISEQTGDPSETFGNLNNLASAYRARGDYGEAEPLFREALAVARGVYGPEHFRVAVVGNNLARTLTDLGRFEEADATYREVLAVARHAFPPGHVNVEIMRGNHACCLLRMGKRGEAREVLAEVHDALLRTLGPDHARTKQVEEWLAESVE